MANEQLILDVDNLEKVNTTINSFLQQVGAHIDEVVTSVEGLGSEWSDGDYELLVKRLKEFYVEFEKLNSNGAQLAQKALEKINQIRFIQGLTIQEIKIYEVYNF